MKRILSMILVSSLIFSVTLPVLAASQEKSAGGYTSSAFRSSADSAVDISGTDNVTEAQALALEGDNYYFAINGEEYDRGKAMSLYTAAAEAGAGEGYYGLGRIYYEKMLATPDRYKTAMDYYDKAIAAGYPVGYYGKGILYQEGRGVETNYAEAQKLYQQAVDAGALEGYLGLGELYEEGNAEGCRDFCAGIGSPETSTCRARACAKFAKEK